MKIKWCGSRHIFPLHAVRRKLCTSTNINSDNSQSSDGGCPFVYTSITSATSHKDIHIWWGWGWNVARISHKALGLLTAVSFSNPTSAFGKRLLQACINVGIPIIRYAIAWSTHPEKTRVALARMAPNAPKPGMMTCRWATALDARAPVAWQRKSQLRGSTQLAMFVCLHIDMDDCWTQCAICQQYSST